MSSPLSPVSVSSPAPPWRRSSPEPLRRLLAPASPIRTRPAVPCASRRQARSRCPRGDPHRPADSDPPRAQARPRAASSAGRTPREGRRCGRNTVRRRTQCRSGWWRRGTGFSSCPGGRLNSQAVSLPRCAAAILRWWLGSSRGDASSIFGACPRATTTVCWRRCSPRRDHWRVRTPHVRDRDGRSCGSRQVDAHPGADRDGARPLGRGTTARDDDRSGLCVDAASQRRHGGVRRCPWSPALHLQHARRGRSGAGGAVRGCGRRGLVRPERRAPRGAGRPERAPRRPGPDPKRPRRRRSGRVGGQGLSGWNDPGRDGGSGCQRGDGRGPDSIYARRWTELSPICPSREKPGPGCGSIACSPSAVRAP